MRLPQGRPRIILIMLLIAVIGAVAYHLLAKPGFRYAGTLEATRVDLPARVASVISSVEVQEGQKAQKGQKLVALACEDIRISAKLANENYDRAVKLFHTGTLSKESFDQTVNRKQESDTRISWCDIQAPIPGTILTRYLEPGEWVNPGTKILSMADLQDIWAYIYVPQAVMSRLKAGQSVTGTIPELADRMFTGTIRKINDEAEFTPKNVQTQAERTRLVFGVKIGFENRDETLKPGMTIEVALPE